MKGFSVFTIIIVFLMALVFVGIQTVATFVMWLFAHALIVGIILLIIYIPVVIHRIKSAARDYHTLGVICAIIHSIFPPIVLYACYHASIEAILADKSIFSFALNWILAIFCLFLTLLLSFYALSYGNSRPKVIILTILYALASMQLSGMIYVAGF